MIFNLIWIVSYNSCGCILSDSLIAWGALQPALSSRSLLMLSSQDVLSSGQTTSTGLFPKAAMATVPSRQIARPVSRVLWEWVNRLLYVNVKQSIVTCGFHNSCFKFMFSSDLFGSLDSLVPLFMVAPFFIIASLIACYSHPLSQDPLTQFPLPVQFIHADWPAECHDAIV